MVPFAAAQALELAPFLEALLDNLTDAVGNTVGAVGSTVGGLLGGLGLGRRLASAGSVSINVYFTVNRIGGASSVKRHPGPAAAGLWLKVSCVGVSGRTLAERACFGPEHERDH